LVLILAAPIEVSAANGYTRQIEAKALRKLREPRQASRLRDYL
jgi:DNA-directed RNA polymerase sigma subunit (sigma70/sigma32)